LRHGQRHGQVCGQIAAEAWTRMWTMAGNRMDWRERWVGRREQGYFCFADAALACHVALQQHAMTQAMSRRAPAAWSHSVG